MKFLLGILLLLIAIGMIWCQADIAGNKYNKHTKQIRKKNARLSGEIDVNTTSNPSGPIIPTDSADRKEVWIPSISTSKLKAEWDHGYSTGFWNSMSEAPVERARAAIVAGFYFQKLYADNPESTFVDVGGGEGVMSDYLSTKQKARYPTFKSTLTNIIQTAYHRKIITLPLFPHSSLHLLPLDIQPSTFRKLVSKWVVPNVLMSSLSSHQQNISK